MACRKSLLKRRKRTQEARKVRLQSACCFVTAWSLESSVFLDVVQTQPFLSNTLEFAGGVDKLAGWTRRVWLFSRKLPKEKYDGNFQSRYYHVVNKAIFMLWSQANRRSSSKAPVQGAYSLTSVWRFPKWRVLTCFDSVLICSSTLQGVRLHVLMS